jgi:FkbM family methyltransferase
MQWMPEGRLFTLLASYARTPLAHPAKVRILRILARCLRTKIVRHTEGGRMKIDETEYIGWSLFNRGSFEPQSVALAIRLMREGGVFLDVGANRGLFSVAVGAATGCEVVSVEPSPDNFTSLLANLKLNPGIRVTPVHCCASPRAMLLQMCSENDALSAWTKVSETASADTLPRVAGLSLDLILGTLRTPSVHLLKIDVEGYELDVLRGLDCDGPHRPNHILMECNPGDHDKVRYLQERGYQARTIHGEDPPKVGDFPEGNLFFSDTRLRSEQHGDMRA